MTDEQRREIKRLLSNITKAVIDLHEAVREEDWLTAYMEVYGTPYDTALGTAVQKLAETLREAEGFEG